MTVDTPRGENALGETVFTRAPDVIHDFLTSVFNNSRADAFRNRIERFIPRRTFPLPFAALARALHGIENPIRIGNLIQRRRAFGAIPSTRTGMLRIPLKLLHLTRDLIDISQQPARGLTVKTRRRHQRVMPLDSPGPRPRIELGPIIPPLLRGKRRQPPPTRPRIKGFVLVIFSSQLRLFQ